VEFLVRKDRLLLSTQAMGFIFDRLDASPIAGIQSPKSYRKMDEQENEAI
jgi:hypothetical protein